ncbi:SDR family oxidoreductase [Shinella kummerowiae]|jgi:NAD(P)-dependent dehydrogenase (short-subunit alcohol dehydrogenase family)|uniref:SDR family oxidoreductase n=1 Tax=Shinella kummerowiae TaxID=417745 RepID=A0A6N8SCH5_9HYPH|nr:SDR family oxidoreductase [Shinella kummerowiae]MXN46371.1 SDR family oxidoreductase [Shinella kummerowiae]
MAGRLHGKRVMVTGAAQGIGLAIAEVFLAEGASLFLIDRDGDLLATEVERLRATGGKVGHATADITDAEAIKRAVAAATHEIGRLNALVNNAGANVFFEPLKLSDADWERCFDINLKGAWNCSKAVLPGMIEDGGGVILNIASTHAFTIIPHTFPYPVAKHALLGMTKALGLEYAGQGVRVNALAPGYVRTQKAVEYWESFPNPVAAEAATMKLHPGGRIAMPEEIAKAALFMVSDECPFMNATCLTVDGGMSVLHHP